MTQARTSLTLSHKHNEHNRTSSVSACLFAIEAMPVSELYLASVPSVAEHEQTCLCQSSETHSSLSLPVPNKRRFQ